MTDPRRSGGPRRPRSGRGAAHNPTGRFERFEVEACDDGWGGLERELAERPVLHTEITRRDARKIVTTNDSPDIPFDRSINPYQGCEHGCIYCFARPSHAYLGLSPGLDFESRIFAKMNAAGLLRRELARRGYRCQAIALGSNTDPYQPVERTLAITRELLDVLLEHRHPVSVVTKSYTILRDADLLGELASQGLARVFVSVTTLETELASRMEPRASTPGRRIETIRRLREAGVPCGVLFSPVIPGLNDHELEAVLAASARAGADAARYLLLRLPWELRELFDVWLTSHYPLRRDKVLSILREMRGGRLNDPRFGHRMTGSGRYAELLGDRFRLAARRHGLDREPDPLRTDLFRLPRGDGGEQGRLFD